MRLRPAMAVWACLLGLMAPWWAHAGDEDSSTQVYLVFDPETGEFVTSHDPNAALPTQTGLEAMAGQAAPSGANGGDDGAGGKPKLIAAAAAAVIVMGGAGFAFLRSRRRAD